MSGPLINVRKRLHEVRGEWSRHNRWACQQSASDEVRAAHRAVATTLGRLVTALEHERDSRRKGAVDA